MFDMSSLEYQITQALDGLSDDSLSFILDMIQRFVKPADTKSGSHEPVRRIGSMRGQRFVAEGHDIDEYDDEIAKLFGVLEE